VTVNAQWTPSFDPRLLAGAKLSYLGGKFGVQIEGLDFTASLSDAQIEAITQLVYQHKVVVFPKTGLDDAAQEKLVARFGKVIPHPTVPSLEGTEAILDVDGSKGSRASSWHADFTFVDAYAKFTFLRGHVLPERGGDTLFSDTVAAYEELPEPLRDLADKAWALHTNLYDYATRTPAHRAWQQTPEGRAHRAVFTHKVFQTEHPLVHVHPVTGARALILGHFIQKLVDFGTTDSRRILDALHDHATSPENTIRWRWSVGDLVVWDNRATLHRAVDDYGDQPRIVRRSTIWGEAPVSIEGRRSVRVVDGIPRAEAA